MAHEQHRSPPPQPPVLTGAEGLVLGVAVLWVVVGAVWALWAQAGLAGLVLALVPPSVAGLSVVVARAVRLMQAEGARLEWAVSALRAASRAPEPPMRVPEAPPVIAPPAPAPAMPPASEPDPTPAVDEPELCLASPEDEPPLTRADLVRALHFPEDEADTEGFAALRRALGNRQARQLIQAAQDVLTLLSRDGIYMDDLVPDHIRPEILRRFAQGERGRPVAQLGGVHDRHALGTVMGRMREDTIFRDTAHHFLRLFDRVLADFEPDATDGELIALSGTRTARAFMVIGRAAGVFG